MTSADRQFERLSFWELLEKIRVQIPLIQRDYAQGRDSKSSVLNSFLNALLDAAVNNPIELDFIYGDVMDGSFRPLDGQQRLTTLFLLHWYAARFAELPLDAYAKELGKFSYDTRVSSRDFCRLLVGELIDVKNISSKDDLSRRIRDCPWFVMSWDFDPTVAGMLAALDKISTLPWPSNLWELLTHLEQSPIRFLKVELKKFGLTDDLYIKMNARGKALTSFENFKALLLSRIEEKQWEAEIDKEKRFPFRVDTIWTDCFWNLCPNNESGLKRIDGAFLAFIAHSLACSIAIHAQSAEKVADTLQKLLNDPEFMKPDDFENLEYVELRERMEIFTKKREVIDQENREDWDFDEILTNSKFSVLREIVSNVGPQYKKRLILHAQMKLHGSVQALTDNEISDWRRIIRNILTNGVVDSPESFVSATRLIEEVSKGLGRLHAFLATTDIQSGFASEQVKEEQRKARLILRHPDQKSLLHRLEDTDFLRGRIAFALDCVNENDPDPENFDFALLIGIADVIEREFSNGINNTIRRALLTIDDDKYFTFFSSWSYTLSLQKYCLIDCSQTFRSFAQRSDLSRKYLRPFVFELIGKSCDQLIANYVPEPGAPIWLRRLIQEPELIEKATKYYIALDEKNQVVYPIPGKRLRDNLETWKYLEEYKIQ